MRLTFHISFHFFFFCFVLLLPAHEEAMLANMRSTILGIPFSVAWSITTVMIPRAFPSPEKMRSICGNRAVAIRSWSMFEKMGRISRLGRRMFFNALWLGLDGNSKKKEGYVIYYTSISIGKFMVFLLLLKFFFFFTNMY